MSVKATQLFSDEQLLQYKELEPVQIVKFLDDFRLMHSNQEPVKSKLISMKVPTDLLELFRQKCEQEGLAYQTQLKNLMRRWLGLN